MTTFLTTTIPYVNAAPHLGFALEAVQADVLARHYRATRRRSACCPAPTTTRSRTFSAPTPPASDVQSFVDANAARFAALAGPLTLAYDDFIRTSRDPRHRPGVEALWRACAADGDLYQDHLPRPLLRRLRALPHRRRTRPGRPPARTIMSHRNTSPNTTGSSGSAATPSRSATRSKPATAHRTAVAP